MKTKFIRISVAFLLCISLLISPALSGKAYASELTAERSTASTRSFTYRHVIEPNAFTNMQILYTVGAVNFVNTVYEANFSASFSTAGSVLTDNYTNISSCPCGITQPCRTDGTCGDDAHHHKDIIDISNSLYSEVPRDQNQIVVLWSDFENDIFCHYKNNGVVGASQHLVVTGAFAMVEPVGHPVIHLMSLRGTTGLRDKALMSLLLAHETAHCLGIDDVYDDGDAHANDRVWNCMMDYIETRCEAETVFYNTVKEHPELAFCDWCREVIEDRFNTNEYNNGW